MSDSLRPHGLSPTRLLCPWDSPGKNTGVGCHFLLQGIFLTPGIECISPALQADSSPSEPPGKLKIMANVIYDVLLFIFFFVTVVELNTEKETNFIGADTHREKYAFRDLRQ